MFSLEAIKAKHGDYLLLHRGHNINQKVALIDGGRDTVYPNLQTTTEEVAGKSGEKELDLTGRHNDDDHMNGMLALTREMEMAMLRSTLDCLHNSLEGLD